MRKLALQAALACLVLKVATAQTPFQMSASQPGPGIEPTLIFPRSGTPLYTEFIDQQEIRQDNGTFLTKTWTVKISRDITGRTRAEREEPLQGVTSIQITDVKARHVSFLDPESLVAYRVTLPNVEPALFIVGDSLAGALGKRTRTVVELGKKTIEGVEFAGKLVTTTIDGPMPLRAVDERWISMNLGMIGLFKSSGPNSVRTITLQHLNRNSPLPGLFVIPPEYEVRYVKGTDLGH